jgi:hypothetical protein
VEPEFMESVNEIFMRIDIRVRIDSDNQISLWPRSVAWKGIRHKVNKELGSIIKEEMAERI